MKRFIVGIFAFMLVFFVSMETLAQTQTPPTEEALKDSKWYMEFQQRPLRLFGKTPSGIIGEGISPVNEINLLLVNPERIPKNGSEVIVKFEVGSVKFSRPLKLAYGINNIRFHLGSIAQAISDLVITSPEILCKVVDKDNQLLAKAKGKVSFDFQVYPTADYVNYEQFTIKFSLFPYGGYGDKRFFWDFGDGTVSDESTPTHTFPGFGRYIVHYRVTDELGASIIGFYEVNYLKN